jgi:hypothetical protein
MVFHCSDVATLCSAMNAVFACKAGGGSSLEESKGWARIRKGWARIRTALDGTAKAWLSLIILPGSPLAFAVQRVNKIIAKP